MPAQASESGDHQTKTGSQSHHALIPTHEILGVEKSHPEFSMEKVTGPAHNTRKIPSTTIHERPSAKLKSKLTSNNCQATTLSVASASTDQYDTYINSTKSKLLVGNHQRQIIAKCVPPVLRRVSAWKSRRWMFPAWMTLLLIVCVRTLKGNNQFLTVARVETCKTVLDFVSSDPMPKESLDIIGSVYIPKCVVLHSSAGVRNPDLVTTLEPLCKRVELFENVKSASSWTENVKQAHVNLLSFYSNESALLIVEDDASLTDAQKLQREYLMFREAPSTDYFRPMFNGWKDTHAYRSGTVAYFCRPHEFLSFFESVGCSRSNLPIDICISKFECFQSCSTCPFHHGNFESTRGKASIRRNRSTSY